MTSRHSFTHQIARAILAGFDRHYGLFRYAAQLAKARFEAGDWVGLRRLSSERIAYYDLRVQEAVANILADFNAEQLDDADWQDVKQHYVGLLQAHKQPECAETFFNSVTCRILHRNYFNNDYIFVRPAVSTEHLDAEPPAYRSYYPLTQGWRRTLRQLLIDCGLACPFVDVERDIQRLIKAARYYLPRPFHLDQDCQLQVLSSLFFRNKGAYLIGRFVNGHQVWPFAVPLLCDQRGQIYIDTLLMESEQLARLFSFARAYFLVDMQVPSAYVEFLQQLLPTKPKAELYSMLGLQKHGKSLFYRDLLYHLRHSTDQFMTAPGIRGLVMAVFTLPSYPYVFKLIKEGVQRRKDVSTAHIKGKYQLVKQHDRVGRMADTWEYSHVALPRERFAPALIEELLRDVPGTVTVEGDAVHLAHVYIERRMVPLNLYLQHANEQERERAVLEYGLAIKELAAANIFPGDMLWKNFGVTPLERVVFYDYDEIQYMTECQFRRIPPAPNPEAEMASEPWYAVGPNDIFPEEFAAFLLGDPKIRRLFMRHHADLLDADYWTARQRAILQGHMPNIFPYPRELRFKHQFAQPVNQEPLC
ncbi:bifunctional isocitrate dehydrogenase kinase/phosphatase [Parvibium lacunae]|uniref:Isocitrate dehydrogenase kinase/phosphatase n=1 Tax=Parvibium lacunae TaxID=1888893 RepID=A0A368L594_9BURK|nr:bifunctional isocitrate dehydrogenase kinase/phosphatase [Parvibium lacunae]